MIYDKLLRLPLFTGMSVDELQQVMSKAKIDFGKYAENAVIVRRGERCSRLLIILDGSVNSHAVSDEGSYSLTETLNAPFFIQPECIFGRFQDFTRTVTALTSVSTITIGKDDIQEIFSHSMVFRLNMLGTMATAIQKQSQELWREDATDLQSAVIAFFRQRCVSPAGHKTFNIKMKNLADILHVSRLEISHVLNYMQSQKLLVLSRGRIDIPDLHLLLNA